uniref:Nucleocapsid protein n=1 Tax=Jingshan Fly Virus 1 TaxID=1608053 RepID=A0A1L3KKL9_9ORTO|nr:nucleocapsid protein [Jingshan Fly Virus 1]
MSVPPTQRPVPEEMDDDVPLPPEESRTKRKLVSPDGRELQEAKKQRANPEMDVKTKAICCILHWHEFLLKEFTVKREHIDDVADITSICWTAHTKFRQETNAVGSLINKITDDHEFKIHLSAVKWSKIKGLKTIAAEYGFDYGTTDNSRSKTGTLGSILCILTSFRPRFNEVRVGTNGVVLKKEGSDTYVMPIEQFGLSSRHQVLTTGCTFNPTLQSSMKQSLGPMTIAINLAMQQETNFQKPWKSAFVNCFKLIPYAQSIADLIAGEKQKNTALMCMLGDIALFGTTRASNKVAFPMSLLLTVAWKDAIYAEYFKGTCPNVSLKHIPPFVKFLDFSGAGAYSFWGLAKDTLYFARRGENMTERTIKECVFLAAWGMQKEDLGILKYMTGHEFQTRREMGNQFKERGSGPDIKVSLIGFRRVCKLASASQTNFVTGGKGQICRAPTVSGKCELRVQLDDDIYKVLEEAREDHIPGALEQSKILARLARVKETIGQRIKKEGVIKYGTTDFYVKAENGNYGDKATDAPVLTSKYFYGQDD